MSVCSGSNFVGPVIEIPVMLKAPWEVLPYAFDYADELAAIGQTIASSFWVVPSNAVDDPGNNAIPLVDGITVNYDWNNPSPTYALGGTFIDGTKTIIMLSQGTNCNNYIVQNCMTTSGGLRYARQFRIDVQGYANPIQAP